MWKLLEKATELQACWVEVAAGMHYEVEDSVAGTVNEHCQVSQVYADLTNEHSCFDQLVCATSIHVV